MSLLAGGCASSPPVRHYHLEPLPGAQTDLQRDYSIGVGPIRFPEYLSRPQIVTRTAGSALKIAEFDRWSEPVAGAFLDVLAINLDQLLQDAVVIQFPYGPLMQPEYRMLGRVSRFDTDTTGVAVLNIQWGVIHAEGGEMVVRVRRDEYRAQANDPGDYDSLVSALNATIEAFSKTAAQEIAKNCSPCATAHNT